MTCFCINVQTLGHGNCCHNRCHLPWRNTPHWKVISPLIPSCFCHGKGLAWDRMKPPEKWLTISNNFCSVIGAIIIATGCYVVAWLQYREEEESKVCEVVMLPSTFEKAPMLDEPEGSMGQFDGFHCGYKEYNPVYSVT